MKHDFRVLLVTNAYFPRIGGITEYLELLVGGLGGLGIPTEVLAMPEEFNRLDEEARGFKIWWRTIHLVFVGAFALYAIGRIAKALRKPGPLIVHSHSASYCLVVGLIAKMLGSHAIHTFHSPLSEASPLLRVAASRLDALVFVSRALGDQGASLGIKNAHRVLIPTAVDMARFHPPSPDERRDASKSLERYFEKTAAAGPTILFVGRIVPEKGVDVLLEALERVFKLLPKARAVIVGPFDLSKRGRQFQESCRALIRRYPLDGRVAMLGSINDSGLLACYWAADVLVCPSTWPEPAAIVVSEGMACALSVVASSVGGLGERVDDKVTGFLVPPGNPDSLAERILGVLQVPDRAASFGEQGRSKVVRELGSDLMVRRHVDLYAGMVTLPNQEHRQESKHG